MVQFKPTVKRDALTSLLGMAIILGGCPKRQPGPIVIYSPRPSHSATATSDASKAVLVIEEPPPPEPAEPAVPFSPPAGRGRCDPPAPLPVKRAPQLTPHDHALAAPMATLSTELGDAAPASSLGRARNLWRGAGGSLDQFLRLVDEAAARLAAVARERATAVMCAEAVWWRCHRALIADAFAVSGWRVLHIGEGGRVNPHPFSATALNVGDRVSYQEDVETLHLFLSTADLRRAYPPNDFSQRGPLAIHEKPDAIYA